MRLNFTAFVSVPLSGDGAAGTSGGVEKLFDGNKVSGKIDFWFQTSMDRMWYMKISQGTGNTGIFFRWNVGYQLQYYDGSYNTIFTYAANTWYHIRIEWNTTTYWNLWIDGVQIEYGGTPNLDYRNNPSFLDRFAYTTSTTLADPHMTYLDGYGEDWLSNYTIGDNLIYSTELIPLEKGWWDLNSLYYDTVAMDSAGTNGGIVNGPTLTTGKINNAIEFDGTNDFIDLKNDEYSATTDSFTMAFWAKPTATRAATTEANSGISGTSNQRYAIYPVHGDVQYGSGHAGAGVSVGTNGVSVFEHSGSYLPSLLVYDTTISDWTHVVVVYENKKPRLYLDGELVRESPFTSSKTVHPGADFGGASYGWYSGMLDDIRLYDYMLSERDILWLYNNGAGQNKTIAESSTKGDFNTIDNN
ncbi:hypothetical protein LCGC14_2718070, partial [marine sediment metagenome]